MTCHICHGEKETRNMNRYVNGSEGLNICHVCEMSIVALIRELSSIAGRSKWST